MSKSKFALGALFGAAVGVIAGLLTAPKSGKETRAELKAHADEAKAKADKAIADAKVKAEKVVTEAKTKGQQVYNEVREQTDTHLEDAKSTVYDYADRVKRAAASAKEELDREDKSSHKKG